MENIPILVYSHSSCDFIWPVTIGQLVKYAPKSEIHFALESECKNQNVIFPSSWNIHKYQDLGLWSKKCLSVLKKIDSEFILYIHEDWLITDFLNYEAISDIHKFMKKTDCDYMLSYSHISVVDSQPGIFTGFENYYYFREKNHIFQPAIWKKSCLEEFCETFDTNFHGNEYEECLNFSRKKILYSVQNKNTVEKFRTTNSLLFPHMHAISTLGTGVQEWTFKKYPSLKSIIESYGVRTDDKGINQIWEIDTQ